GGVARLRVRPGAGVLPPGEAFVLRVVVAVVVRQSLGRVEGEDGERAVVEAVVVALVLGGPVAGRGEVAAVGRSAVDHGRDRVLAVGGTEGLPVAESGD